MSELAKTHTISISSTAMTETTMLSILIRTTRMTYLVTRISLTILILILIIIIITITHQAYLQQVFLLQNSSNISADPLRI